MVHHFSWFTMWKLFSRWDWECYSDLDWTSGTYETSLLRSNEDGFDKCFHSIFQANVLNIYLLHEFCLRGLLFFRYHNRKNKGGSSISQSTHPLRPSNWRKCVSFKIDFRHIYSGTFFSLSRFVLSGHFISGIAPHSTISACVLNQNSREFGIIHQINGKRFFVECHIVPLVNFAGIKF